MRTVIGMSLGLLLGGTWIVETVFYIPGTGALAILAIMKRDFPVIQGTMIFTALIFVLVNVSKESYSKNRR
jgi:peptide/nickel transport system permease protein